MSKKRRSAVTPLPPGIYTATVQSVRKVRNKNAFRMTLDLGDGVVMRDTIHYAGAPKGRNMPKIDRPEEVRVTYSPEDIVKLIIVDLVEQHGISAQAADIHVMISGGTMYDANAAYSGGGGPDYTVDPVSFNGFSAVGKDVRK